MSIYPRRGVFLQIFNSRRGETTDWATTNYSTNKRI